MSLTSSPSVDPSQSFVLSSPDRVVFKTIPHPLSSANKRVTLSLRRPAAASTPTTAAAHPLPPSPQDLFPHTHHGEYIIHTAAEQQQSNSDPEDSTVPVSPRNSLSPNSSHSHHRRSMSSSLTQAELTNIAAKHNSIRPASTAVRMQIGTKQINMGHGNTAGQVSTPTTAASADSVATPTTPTTPTPTATTTTTTPSPVVRYHKNGLPIKSALKSPRPLSTVDGNTSPRPSPSRSLSSPYPLSSPKYVHFNTQLEHVRLFLQGETPSSVATRETIIDPRQHEAATSSVSLTLPNWTPLPSASAFQPTCNMDAPGAPPPLRCENVHLNEDRTKLVGTILVQNIAFHKHVSVRYTVDFWQSHAEQGAEYVESLSVDTAGAASVALDRFKFELPLEMDKSCVEKSFCLAIRYLVNGREFWDSNHGLNYQIECKREIVVPSVSEITKKMNTMMLGSNLPEYHKPVLRKKSANNRYDLSSSLSATLSTHHRSTATTNSATSTGRSTGQGSLLSSPLPSRSMPMSVTHPSGGSQSPYRASEYISASIQSPPDFHRQLYASSPKFISPYMGSSSPPEHFRIGFEPIVTATATSTNKKHNAPSSPLTTQWGFEIESPAPPMVTRGNSFPPSFYGASAKSAPISIPTKATPSAGSVGQNGRPAVGSAGYYDLVDRYCFYESSPHSSPYSTYSDSPPAPCIRG